MTDKRPLPPGVAPLPPEPIVQNAAAGQRMSLPQAMAVAEQRQREGRLDLAETILRQIVQARPTHAPALHLLGVVSHQQGRTDLAVQFVRQAIEADPTRPAYFANLGEMSRVLGQLDEAIAAGERAIELDPNYAPAYSNVGIAFFDREDYERAEQYQQRALAIDPRLVAALNNLGSICRERKDLDGASRYYREVLALAPNHVEALNNLGAVHSEAERYDEAITSLRRAIELRPAYVDAHCNLGLALCGDERYDEALTEFRRTLELRPDYVGAYVGMARALQERSEFVEARTAAERALALDPKKPETRGLLGSIYTDLGFPDRAQAEYEAERSLDPSSTRPYLGLGTLWMELGHLERAARSFEDALAIDPECVAARVSIAQVRKTVVDDPNLAALVDAARDIDSMPRLQAMALHFALGKCFDDVGDYDRAFEHFRAGCAIKRARIQYDANHFDQLVERLIRFFDSATLTRLRGRGEPSDLPIFVLGMARSGTTLTEQIVASHPAVYGAGELMDLLNLCGQPRGVPDTRPFPDNMTDFTPVDLSVLGARYVGGLRARAPTAQRITDKMPANFLCVGLIHLMLPNARIVHVKRNPVDTCFSGYSRLFKHGQPHSYDLTELGRYYRSYARLMDHWRAVLPAGAMHEVQYEDLVANNEAEARRLIEFCGLPWDDACLNFFENERSIKTASLIQVRQPIYKTSLDRWRRYEKHLGPLLEVLGDLVPRT